MKNYIFLFFSLVLLHGALGQTLTYSDENVDVVNVERYLEVFEDKTNQLSIDRVAKTHFLSLSTRNFGHTSSAIWYRFEFNNISQKPTYLQITPEWLHHIEFYQLDENKNVIRQKHGGTMFPYADRELRVNKHSFALAAGHFTYYVKISGDHVISPHFLVGEKIQMLMHDRIVDHVYFLYFGIIFLLFGYNLFLTLVIKKKSYAYYTGYIFFLLIGVLFIKGFINEWFDLFWLSNHSNIITAAMMVCIMMSVAFFTKTPLLYPVLNKVKAVIICFLILSIFLNLLGFVRYANMIVLNMAFVGGVWGLIVGVKTIENGQPASVFIFLGYASFILGGVLHTLCLHGVIPFNWFTHNTYLIGSGFEVVFLTFSFGVNLNSLRREKYRTQKELVQMAQDNEQLIREQNKVLEERVEERTANLYDAYEEIQVTLNTVHEQKMLIEEKSMNITDSITYAKRIQDAMLPDLSFVNKHQLDVGIFYQPKDILSGDFYWFGERNGKLIIAVADCTGHGVPGAMMSITGHNLLNKIVHEQKVSAVDEVLNLLHIELIELLKAEQTDTQDGMDIQLISFDKETRETCYAAARNPVYFVDDLGVLNRVKGDRCSIGGTQMEGQPDFTKHVLPTNWSTLFLCSDGYQDQFGVEDKKFMVGRMKKKLLEVAELTPTEQMDVMKKEFFAWKGNREQTDDVLVLSLKK